MKSAARALRLFLLALILSVIPACADKVEAITIAGEDIVSVGKSIILELKTEPPGARVKSVAWSSSDPEVASVASGKVTGIQAGTAVITAAVGEVSATHEVRVIDTVDHANLFAGVNIIGEAKTGELAEIDLVERDSGFIAETYNPYDRAQVSVYADFTAPSGKTWRVPAFWYHDYYFTFDETFKEASGVSGVASLNPEEPQGLEKVEWQGEPRYRLRVMPDEAGEWNARLYVEQFGILTQSMPFSFRVEPGKKTRGMIEVDPTNKRFFRYRSGETFIPIGINLGWWTHSARKTYDYEVWMGKMSAAGMNFARIWLAPWGFALHWGNSYDNFDDRQNSAARLDRVLRIAEENGVYIMLTLNNHGQFSSQVNPNWRENPYNILNNGILTRPEHFFSNAKAKAAYKNELAYIIGRWGYSEMIMAWELFNEVNWTDNYQINAVNINNWHREMARFLKENDYRGRMVTTSYNYEQGAAYRLEEIDFVNPHNYDYNDKSIPATLPAVLNQLHGLYDKPVLQSEIGINWQNGYSTAQVDPAGITLRQAAWAGMMGGGAGGAMHWWWDSWVHPGDLYHQFRGAAAFSRKLNLSGAYEPLSASFSRGSLAALGYSYPDRVYGYIYDTRWVHSNDKSTDISGATMNIVLPAGTYAITYYNAHTGEEISTGEFTAAGGSGVLNLPAFRADVAFIIEKR
jgi:hypothetical protein